MRGSSISSGATPAHWSVVMLRTQLPLVCMPCSPRVGEVRHGVRQLGELDPVELNVLSRGEMAVAAVIAPRHVGELAQLIGGKRAVGNGDPQHVGVQLQIDAVHQPQRLELILVELAGEPARDLTAELSDALRQQGPVEVVVEVHA